MDMRSSLNRVRGLGSAKEGVGHFWMQRLTAIALVPLALWFAFSVVGLVGADHAAFTIWASNFGNSLLLILLVIAAYHHLQLGMQVVIEDYVHEEAAKLTGLVLVKLGCFGLAAASILAVVRVGLGS
jgi:succinate dehydrogenase / fumarate reductase membrane anchor subunit